MPKKGKYEKFNGVKIAVPQSPTPKISVNKLVKLIKDNNITKTHQLSVALQEKVNEKFKYMLPGEFKDILKSINQDHGTSDIKWDLLPQIKKKGTDWKNLERKAQARIDQRQNVYNDMMNNLEYLANAERVKKAFKPITPLNYVGRSQMKVKQARAAIERLKKKQIVDEPEDDIVITNVPKPKRKQTGVKTGTTVGNCT